MTRTIGIDAAVAKTRSRVANAARRRDLAALTEAKREHAEAKLAAYITQTIAAAPPLTADQCARIAALLVPGDSGGRAA